MPKNEGRRPTESSLFIGKNTAFIWASLFISGHALYVAALN